MPTLESDLRTQGFARLGTLLSPAQCLSLQSLYSDPSAFRSRIVMQRHSFGRGEYQYFAYPLPEPVATLRESLYATLAPIATQWATDTKLPTTYPPTLSEFLALCHAAGQTRPTPLLLQYNSGDYNCLHQDLYGDIAFPFQVIIALSDPTTDYTGGELLLVESRPRLQSIGRALRLAQGEAIVITTRYRPVQGTRGFYRANIRHGVSLVESGRRFTLGLIFHDAMPPASTVSMD